MSKKIDDGGPAFPVLEFEYKSAGDIHPSPSIYPGMTKREEFAKAVLQGLAACPSCVLSVEDTAALSVRYADALIAELKKAK